MTIDNSILTLIIALIVFGAVFVVSYNRSGNIRKSLYSAGFAYCIIGIAFFILLPIRISSDNIDSTIRVSLGECFMYGTNSVTSMLNVLFAGFGFSLFGGMLHGKIRNPLAVASIWIGAVAAYIDYTFIINNIWHDYVKTAYVVDIAVLAAGMAAGCALAAYFIKADPELSNKINSVKSNKSKKELYKDMSDI